MYEMKARKRKASAQYASVVRAPPLRNIMEVDRLFAHPSKYIIRPTGETSNMSVTGEWRL